MQPKIRQIAGLEAALTARATSVSNVGATGVGLYKGKNGAALEFYKLSAGTGIVSLAVNANIIEIEVDVGTTAGKIVQLDNNGRLPILDGRNLTNINPDAITGSFSAVLALTQGYFFVGSSIDRAEGVPKVSIPLSGFGVAQADISLGAYKISTTAVTFGATDLVPRTYVDDAASVGTFRQPVRVASTANVSIASAPSAIDGVTLAVADRILLKNQSVTHQNGVYTFASAGAPLVRATDMNTAARLRQVSVYVKEGTTHGEETYHLITEGTITVGSTPLLFVRVGSNTAAPIPSPDATLTFNVLAIENTPPISPVDGDKYIVGTTPTLAWGGHADEVAVWNTGEWQFYTPDDGWLAYNKDDSTLYIYDSDTGWSVLIVAGSQPYEFGVFIPEAPPTEGFIFRHVFTRDVEFLEDLTDSIIVSGTAPTVSRTLTLQKVSGGITTDIGEAIAPTGTPLGTFDFPADVTFTAGEILQAVPTNPVPDATWANVNLTFVGTKI